MINIDFRNIERGWRADWMRLMTWMLPHPRTTTLPSFTAKETRVLFLRFERIGDLILATGMIRVLATAHPSIVLDVLATPTTRPVLDGNPYVRKVLTLDRRSWGNYYTTGRTLRDARYDIIVDGRINQPQTFTTTPFLMLMARAPYRVGVGGGNNDQVYNVRVRPYDRHMHYVDGSSVLAEPFGVAGESSDASRWQPELYLSSAEVDWATHAWYAAHAERRDAGWHSEDSRRMLVNLSASEPKRRWGDERFIAVLHAVREIHPTLPMVIMGLPGEWERVQRVAHTVGAWPQQTSMLRDALALVGTSDRVFTPDTSISHATSAFRTPAVVLLKQDHAPYAPWNTPAEIVFWTGDMIDALPVEPVREAVLRLACR